MNNRSVHFAIKSFLLCSFAMFLFSWQTDPGDALAVRISQSSNFIQWNNALSDFEKESTLSFHRNKAKKSPRPARQKDLDRIMNDSRLSDAAKKDSISRLTPISESMHANFKKSRFYLTELGKEFPELTALSVEGRKSIFGRAIKLYNKNHKSMH